MNSFEIFPTFYIPLLFKFVDAESTTQKCNVLIHMIHIDKIISNNNAV